MQGILHHHTCEPWGGGGTREHQYNESNSTQQEESDPSDFDEVSE
jgi:hypothetical protein